jgi:uncharacterized protein (DUF952 family)
MKRLFHLLDPDVWAATVGEYRPPSLAEAGFIHFSFADPVVGTANGLYLDAPRLCVLEVDPARIRAEIVVEDSYGTGVEFPHLYGPLPVEAVIAVHELPRGRDGRFTFDAGAPA